MITKEQQEFVKEANDFKADVQKALQESRQVLRKGNDLIKRFEKLEKEVRNFNPTPKE